ncbi:chemokine-like receptor 1 [Polyodon spathula]|uniref:chemokine-like receptor 1 n=1 Tax=Polyodon spathula TaxID=7913 RepID=UPI001B7DE4DB|nr:chemokine-like receptor 1 [Polyodon spathula]XP_041079859.1 chemokine-like receptor 1 [Polyodon spathula]
MEENRTITMDLDYEDAYYYNYTYFDQDFYSQVNYHESSNHPQSHIEGPFKIFLIVLLAIIFLLGLCGNGLVIWMTGFKMKRTVNTTWFLSLAIADFIFCVFIPFSIVHLALDHHWPFGLVMCKLTSFIMFLNMFVSIFLLTLISIDRCVSVIFPVWSQNYRTLRVASVVVLAAWVASALLSTPSLVFRDIHSTDEKTTCYNNYILASDQSHLSAAERHKAVSLTRFICGFVIPFTIIVFCYSFIVAKVRNNCLAKSSKPFRITAGIIVAFFVCWLPYHVFNILVLNHREIPQSVLHYGILIANSLLTANSFLNPVLYVFMGKNFKKTFEPSVFSRLENALSEDTRTTSKHSSGMRSELERSSMAI